jgi:hypothetical protein
MAVGDQRAQRQHQQRLRVGGVDRQLVDQFFQHQRHADVGHLGADQGAERGHHAPFVDPQVGEQRFQGRPVAALPAFRVWRRWGEFVEWRRMAGVRDLWFNSGRL